MNRLSRKRLECWNHPRAIPVEANHRVINRVPRRPPPGWPVAGGASSEIRHNLVDLSRIDVQSICAWKFFLACSTDLSTKSTLQTTIWAVFMTWNLDTIRRLKFDRSGWDKSSKSHQSANFEFQTRIYSETATECRAKSGLDQRRPSLCRKIYKTRSFHDDSNFCGRIVSGVISGRERRR